VGELLAPRMLQSSEASTLRAKASDGERFRKPGSVFGAQREAPRWLTP